MVPTTFFQPSNVYPTRDKVAPSFKVMPVAPFVYVASATDPVPPLTLYEIEYEIPAQIA